MLLKLILRRMANGHIVRAARAYKDALKVRGNDLEWFEECKNSDIAVAYVLIC